MRALLRRCSYIEKRKIANIFLNAMNFSECFSVRKIFCHKVLGQQRELSKNLKVSHKVTKIRVTNTNLTAIVLNFALNKLAIAIVVFVIELRLNEFFADLSV